MRHHALPLLFVLLPALSTAYAEESGITNPAAMAAPRHTAEQVRIDQLEQALAGLTRQRDELLSQQENNLAERESAQMEHLQAENQKLKLQLREALAQQPQSPLTDTQTWYLVGGVTALFGAAVGALLRGNRRRRQWIN